MPPKVKISEDAILEASVQLIREHGFECFNSRDLAKKLNCYLLMLSESHQ